MNIKETAFSQISKFKFLLDEEGISTSTISERDYNYEILAKINRANIKIQVYFGKKGVKTIIQGDSSSSEYQTIQNIIQEQSELNFQKENLSEPGEYIGSDECGKGDFFGPLVTAAVFVDNTTQSKLRKIGVRDSKDLKENQITELAFQIKETIGNNYEVIKINPSKYNQLYEKFNNLNKLLNWSHSKAIDSLLQKTNCKTVITDKFSNKDLNVTFDTNHSSVKFIQEPRAEKYVGVAAASILARNEFNQWFIQQKKLGYDLPKGSSEIVTDAASNLLKKIDKKTIGDFVKLHFKTLQKITIK
jgi:ribonuclease HIII